jgi:BMFP domain-containing protein YqiC
MTTDQTRTRTDDAVIGSFMERLLEQIEALLPEDSVNSVLEQARAALRQGFAEFDLVPRHELDGHLAALGQLTETIKDLEARIARLEAGS